MAVLLLLPTVSFAQVGIGVSLRDGDAATIYVPIDLSPALRVEPFFSWSDTDAGGVTAEERQLGGGFFFRTGLVDNVQAYGGGRIGYMQVETTVVVGPGLSATSDLDGFSVEPTIGVEYFFVKRFSVAGEAYLYYETLEGDIGGADQDADGTGTGTRVLARFMF